MKIKRFKGKTTRQALHNVRAELGPDAVILSNNTIEDGVEVLAATDTDWPVEAEKTAAAPQTATPPTQATSSPADPLTAGERSDAARLAAMAARVTARNAQPTAISQAKPFPERSSDALLGRYADQASALQKKADRIINNGINNGANPPTATHHPTAKEALAVSHTHTPPKDTTSNDAISRELRSLRNLVERQLAGLAWGELSREQPKRAELMEHLLAFGLPPHFCKKLADLAQEDTFTEAWKETMVKLIERIPCSNSNILEHGGVVALVGPTGVGKTTTVAKLAGQFSLRHGPGSVALITVDGQRIGTQEQLRAFGRILDIPVSYAADHEELKGYLARYKDRKLVIVDTSGISHRDPNLMEHMSMFSEDMPDELQTFVVVAANTQPKGIIETINAFRRYEVQGAIVTKLDEAESLGGVVSALAKFHMPLAFTTNGQQVPDDLAIGSPYELVKLGIELMREDPEQDHSEYNCLSFGPLMTERYA